MIIDHLSDLKDSLIVEVNKKMKYIMLHGVEEKLLRISEKELNGDSIKAFEASLLWQIIKGNG